MHCAYSAMYGIKELHVADVSSPASVPDPDFITDPIRAVLINSTLRATPQRQQ